MYTTEEITDRLFCGDCREVLKEFPDNSIDCVITSPPYWSLRDYGVEGIGLEHTYTAYIAELIAVFDEIKRVLKPTGSAWVNIGDVYSGSGCGHGQKRPSTGFQNVAQQSYYATHSMKPLSAALTVKKNLLLLPHRFAICMEDIGKWICRNEIIWYKHSCMPSSARDRFTVDFEQFYWFVQKSKDYFFVQQREPVSESHIRRAYSKNNLDKRKDYGKQIYSLSSEAQAKAYEKMREKMRQGVPITRNMRCVWNINPRSFKGTHFAVFPPELVERPLAATCPPYVCDECGKPYMPHYSYHSVQRHELPTDDPRYRPREYKGKYDYTKEYKKCYSDVDLLGFEPSCTCGASSHPGIVLDPFIGSGTTALMARKMGYHFVGIDTNPEYIEMSEKRLNEIL